MELTQGMELAQVLKLSPGLLQSMEMLQMNTLELGAYLKELALENPVLEEAEPGQGAWYEGYLEAAAREGLAQPEELADPNAPMTQGQTRAQAAAELYELWKAA